MFRSVIEESQITPTKCPRKNEHMSQVFLNNFSNLRNWEFQKIYHPIVREISHFNENMENRIFFSRINFSTEIKEDGVLPGSVERLISLR